VSYFDEARARAARRKSPWNLLLIPAVVIPWIAIGLALMGVLAALHEALYESDPSWRAAGGIGPVLVGVGSIVGTIPLAMLIGNALASLVSPARRAFEREAEGHPRASYPRAQADLFRFAAIVFPAGLAVATVGALMRWSLR